METTTHVGMVICFFFSGIVLLIPITGNFLLKLIFKAVALIGLLASILFYINYFKLVG
jgi:hypothetical protein